MMAVTAVLVAGCASRGTVHRLESDVLALRADLADARAARARVAHDLAASRAALQSLDAQTRELAMRTRATTDELARVTARLDAAEAEIRKTRALVERPAPAPPPLRPVAPPSVVPRAPAAPVPAAPPPRMPAPRPASRVVARASAAEPLYTTALAMFRAREYGQAVLDFTDLIGKHPRHPLAANAQYWIGEAYYAQRDYRQALLEFRKVIEMGAAKVPDALLKIGLCYWNLRDGRRARSAWQTVVDEHPRTEPATLARALLLSPGRR